MMDAEISNPDLVPPVKDSKRTIRIPLRGVKGRRQLRVGCLPATALFILILMGVGALLTFQAAPSYILRPRAYLIEGQLIVALAVLFVTQLLAGWVLGVMSARGAVLASYAGEETNNKRMRIVRRWMFFPTLSVVLPRLLFVVVLLIGSVFAFTGVLGPPVRFDSAVVFRNAFRLDPLTILAAIAFAFFHWFVGPYLRMRYTTALAGLAASYALVREDRASLAVASRFGAGLMLALSLMWGGALAVTGWLMVFDPYSAVARPIPSFPIYLPPTYSTAFAVLIAQGFILYIGVFTIAQLVLPLFFRALTRSRLRKRFA